MHLATAHAKAPLIWTLVALYTYWSYPTPSTSWMTEKSMRLSEVGSEVGTYEGAETGLELGWSVGPEDGRLLGATEGLQNGLLEGAGDGC